MNTKYCLIALMLITLTSCAVPIKSRFVQNETIITKGETAKIFWEFTGAERVTVEGIKREFSAIDLCFVSPDETTMYYVTGSNSHRRHLTIKWLVSVIEPIEIMHEPDANVEFHTLSSEIPLYDRINTMSITGASVKPNNEGFALKFYPVNKEGHFLSNLNISKNSIELSVRNLRNPINITNIGENVLDLSAKYHFCICLDNSSAGVKNGEILTNIIAASKHFPINDNFYFSLFNQNFAGVEQIHRTSTGSFYEGLKNIPPQSGFSAINKSVGRAVNYLLEKTDGKKILIIIANNADNASVLYDEKDLMQHCNNHNIPVYVIAIGSSILTYNLSYLTNGTGGKIYFVDEDNIDLIQVYLREIIESQKKFYEVAFSTLVPKNTQSLNVELSIPDATKTKKISDSYFFPLEIDKIYSEFQVLASFSLGDTTLSQNFHWGISHLAEVLIKNPTLVVELIGHSGSIEGTDAICHRLGLRRAQAVRKKLIEFGADPAQIRLSSEGSAVPLFQTPRSDWQFKYNNRVEIRWLLPEDKPFEILAGFGISETDAQLQVEKWEDENYKAYYQRIMRNNRPAYRILIWDYSTEAAAEAAAKALTRKYKKTFTVR